MIQLDSFYILGVRVNITNLPIACRKIEEWIQGREKTYVCIAPVSMIVDCQSDQQYREIVNGAGMTTPDGMPLVWLGKTKGFADMDRTYGPDLLPAFCSYGQNKRYRHYFYGGTQDILEQLIHRLKGRFPQLEIAGHYAPPMRSIGEKEEENVLHQINQSRPDILWIGLGSPKQDYWMYNHRGKLDVPVMVGVGAAFDFISGFKKQAPFWMQRNGLEWLFRLCSEPRRLWKRYILGNTFFIYLLLKEKVLGSRKS